MPAARSRRWSPKVPSRGLPVEATQLGGFVADLAAAREAPLIHRSDLSGISLATGVDAMLIPHAGGWSALLPLEARHAGPGAFSVDLARVEAALKPVAAGGAEVVVLDLKRESDALYGGYLGAAVQLSLAGLQSRCARPAACCVSWRRSRSRSPRCLQALPSAARR